jgi:hypothetical protein
MVLVPLALSAAILFAWMDSRRWRHRPDARPTWFNHEAHALLCILVGGVVGWLALSLFSNRSADPGLLEGLVVAVTLGYVGGSIVAFVQRRRTEPERRD